MVLIVSADSSHRARKRRPRAAHIAKRRLRVWGASDLLYYCQGNNTKYMAVYRRDEAEERERTITRAKKRARAFVLQALTSNIRRDNKCSAALCAALGPSLDLCSTAGWPRALANRSAVLALMI